MVFAAWGNKEKQHCFFESYFVQTIHELNCIQNSPFSTDLVISQVSAYSMAPLSANITGAIH